MNVATSRNTDVHAMKCFVGTCVNSFDDDGECLLPILGWDTVSDFTCAEESATRITAQDFNSAASASKILASVSGHELRYLLTEDSLLMLHDLDDDIHYFFV